MLDGVEMRFGGEVSGANSQSLAGGWDEVSCPWFSSRASISLYRAITRGLSPTAMAGVGSPGGAAEAGGGVDGAGLDEGGDGAGSGGGPTSVGVESEVAAGVESS